MGKGAPWTTLMGYTAMIGSKQIYLPALIQAFCLMHIFLKGRRAAGAL